jgi:hypothetical protein
MSLRLIVSQPSDLDIYEAVEAQRRRYFDDYRVALRDGDVITADWIEYEVEQYDAANPAAPGEPTLLDEIRGLSILAAA